MSITFFMNSQASVEIEESCMCAQFAPRFFEFDQGARGEDVRAELREHARPDCPCCQGSGVIRRRGEAGPSMNLNQGNAAALLGALGLGWTEMGCLSLPEARRALMRARNVSLEKFTRAERVEYGAPRQHEDGTTELRPLRYLEQGLTADRLTERLSSLGRMLEEGAAQGATELRWY